MVRLLLIRHAQSAWNAAGRWQGWADPPLSPVGEQQAAAAGQALLRAGTAIDAVISSDLVRAARSAALVAAAACPGVPRTTDAGWREYRVGAWSGLTRAQIEQGWPGVLSRYDNGQIDAAPGGEPRGDFERRLAVALRRAVDRLAPSGAGLVVSHGGSIRAIARSLDAPLHRVGNLAGIAIEASPLPGSGPVEAVVTGLVDLLGSGAEAPS